MTKTRSFALLCGVGLFAFISYNLVRVPLLPLFANSLGARPEMIGFIVSASTLTGVFLKWPAGALSDIYDRRWLLLAGLLAFALPPFGYLFISDVGWLIVLRFLHGMATAVFAPIALAVVADLYRETRGVVAGFSTAFVIAGAMGSTALLIFIILRLPPQIPHIASGIGPVAVMRDMARGARTVVGNFRVLATSATDGARQIANGALMAFLPIYVVGIGYDATHAGILFGLQSVTSFVSRPTMGWASDRIGRRPLILAGLMLCAAALAAVPFTTFFPGLVSLSAAFGFGEAIVNACSAALVADLSELKTLGSAMGMQGAITDIGHASGPILTGLLVGAFGFQAAFPMIAGLVLLAAFGFYLSVRDERTVDTAA